MKKFFLFATLLCGTSFASMANDLSFTTKPVSGYESVANPTEINMLAPTRLANGSFTANGQTYVFVYDTSIPGDFQEALSDAIAYAAWRKANGL